MVLRELTIAGFKSYVDEQRLPLAPLTVLIGANASGKSNLIEAIQLLAWLARGHRLGDLPHALREGDLLVRGRIGDLPALATAPIQLGCLLADHTRLQLGIGVAEHGARVVSEQLDVADASTELPYYWIERPAAEHGMELVVAYNNFSKGDDKPFVTCIDQQPVFTQLRTSARFSAEHAEAQRKIPAANDRLVAALDGILLLDPHPLSMRGYSYLDETELLGNGSNVSSVLARLCEQEHRLDEVLAFVRSLPEQDIRDVAFLHGPRRDVMVRIVETFSGRDRAYDAAVLSDGTLRVLAVAAAVLSVAEGSLVVVEEIDNGVHPSRASLLMDALHSAAHRRGLRLLVTTHNPALLDAIPPAAIGDTVACYRDPDTGASRLVQLRALEEFAALAARGPLGSLAATGVLDRFLKSRRSAADRDRDAAHVLELFKPAGS